MDSPYRRELEVVFAAVRVASRLSQHIISSDKGVVEKKDTTPVTVADFAIQALLTATIKAAFPGDRVVGEEDASQLRTDLLLLERVYDVLRWACGYGEGPGAEAARAAFPEECHLPRSREHMCELIDECGSTTPGAKGRTWIIDPIDGTKNFVRGDAYAINVALLVDGAQMVGVVGCPNWSAEPKQAPLSNGDTDKTGSIVFAVRGHGAYVRGLGDDDNGSESPRRLPTHEQDLGLCQARFVSCVHLSDSAMEGVHEATAERMGVPFPGCDLLPWVLRWVALARGLGNTTVWAYRSRERLAKVWDHAGAILLFEETGGRVTDVRGRAVDLVAGRKMTANYGFVAAPGELHGRVLETVRGVMRDMGNGDFLE